MNEESFSYIRIRRLHRRVAREAQARGAGLITSHIVAAVANRPSSDIVFAIPRDGVDEWFRERSGEIVSLSAQGVIVERIYPHSERTKMPRLTWGGLRDAIRYGNSPHDAEGCRADRP